MCGSVSPSKTSVTHVDIKKKIAQGESCQVSFICGKVRTASWEDSSEKPLRRGRGKGQ